VLEPIQLKDAVRYRFLQLALEDYAEILQTTT